MRVSGDTRERLAAAVVFGVRPTVVVHCVHRRIRAKRQPQHERSDHELREPQQRERQPQRHLHRCYYGQAPLQLYIRYIIERSVQDVRVAARTFRSPGLPAPDAGRATAITSKPWTTPATESKSKA